jgi:hypothetical protein
MKNTIKTVFLMFISMSLFNCTKKADVAPISSCKYQITFMVDGITKTQHYEYYNAEPSSNFASTTCMAYPNDVDNIRIESVSAKDSSTLVSLLKVLPKKFNVTSKLTNSMNDSAIEPPFTFNCNLTLNDQYYTVVASNDIANYYNQITGVKLNADTEQERTWDIEGNFKVNVVNTQNKLDIKTVIGTYKYVTSTSRK